MVILHLATITLSSAASNTAKSPKTDVAVRFQIKILKNIPHGRSTAKNQVPQKSRSVSVKALVHCYILLYGINQTLEVLRIKSI